MENGGGGDGVKTMFTDEEVSEISEFKRIGDDHVEVRCGCTSFRYGDAGGILRVFPDGHLEVRCQCTPGCEESNLSPAAFEKHSGKEKTGRWRSNIWVIVDGLKVPVTKTALLKYYNKFGRSNRSKNIRVHHDEFVRCTVCGKQRRFHLRNKEECRAYHDALRNVNWKCSDVPYEKVTCGDEEERATRRVYMGCSRSQTCKGCTSCVCFGCEICRFADCSCQTCIDFTRNVKN